ncbi:MAG: signal peptidase I [Anaerolineales bacterium]|nr:signal peptidase I [Anaerolineales bacterium]
MNTHTFDNKPSSEPDSPSEWLSALQVDGSQGEEIQDKTTFRSKLYEFFETLLIAAILFVVINIITARVVVESVSMQPNLYEGELIIVNKLAYRWSEPDRGDIVVFPYPLNQDIRFIKRVIGIPGDHVVVQNGQTIVNGIVLYEPYLTEVPAYTGEWTVGDSEVFVLGDNRNNSNDSSRWGNVPLDDLLGKAVLVYWPLQDFHMIPHYNLTVNGG